MSDSSARLVTRRGPASEQSYPLSEHTIVVGREPINDIAIPDLEISRRHASFTYREGRYLVEDLGSTNGTFVNGRRISEPTPLSDGDVVDLAQSTSFIFRSTAGDVPQSPPPQAPPDEEYPDTILDDESFAAAFEELQALEEPAPEEVLTVSGPDEAPAAETTTSGLSRFTNRQIVIGCGCLLLAMVAGCGAGVFLLDRLAAEALYCGALQPAFELIFSDLSCP
ncbi:MAG: FHA domain-containing protein [Candidatus Promineifilaceae bacterium]|nr:FHA domain-containing protein [Candidatus Promineifilaceae bacterium]